MTSELDQAMRTSVNWMISVRKWFAYGWIIAASSISVVSMLTPGDLPVAMMAVIVAGDVTVLTLYFIAARRADRLIAAKRVRRDA